VCWRVSCYFPGITLGALTVLNLMIWHTGSSGAIPLGAFFSLVALWFIISIPLCFSGTCRNRPSAAAMLSSLSRWGEHPCDALHRLARIAIIKRNQHIPYRSNRKKVLAA
jgi:Endomembrane protein 70